MERRPVAVGRLDAAHHPEPQPDACLAVRRAFAPGNPGRVAQVDATPEIFGRLVVDQPVSAQQELSLQERPEQRLRDVAPQELPAARERSGSRRVLPDAVARWASGQPLEELRQVVAQWMARREQPLDAAAEHHSDG